MRISKTDAFLWAVTLAATAALAYGAFRIVGFLGVALLGLMMVFIAVQVDLDKDGAIGGVQNADMYARQAAVRQQMSRAEKAAHRSEMQALAAPIMAGKILGCILAVVGLAGLLFW